LIAPAIVSATGVEVQHHERSEPGQASGETQRPGRKPGK
jgi:hypothetical protein